MRTKFYAYLFLALSLSSCTRNQSFKVNPLDGGNSDVAATVPNEAGTTLSDAIIDPKCAGCVETQSNTCVPYATQTLFACGHNGEACNSCQDAFACTDDACLPTGTCKAVIKPGFCLIDKKCYAENEVNPENSCEICSPITKANAWTSKTLPCVATFTGKSSFGSDDGPIKQASFYSPWGLALDAQGNFWITEPSVRRLRKIYRDNSGQWQVLTLSDTPSGGYKDGPIAIAQFNDPETIIHLSDNKFWMSDGNNQALRQIVPDSTNQWIVSTIKKNYNFTALLTINPNRVLVAIPCQILAFDKSGDTWNESLFAGLSNGCLGNASLEGEAKAVSFSSSITGLTIDPQGNIYVADGGNYRIRKIGESTPGQWNVTTFAGTGTGGSVNGAALSATFSSFMRLLWLPQKNTLLVADTNNNSIRAVLPNQGAYKVETVAGSSTDGNVDGAGNLARFKSPRDMVLDANGVIYLTDAENYKIRILMY